MENLIASWPKIYQYLVYLCSIDNNNNNSLFFKRLIKLMFFFKPLCPIYDPMSEAGKQCPTDMQ